MRYYIKEAEDFGLTFNMVIRMYMRHYDKDILEPSPCYVKDKIPIKKMFFEDFGKACYWLVSYSYGRHTYMPNVANSFIRANTSLIKNNELICIRDAIANFEEDGKISDTLLDYSNDNIWISLREFLNREIALRN